MSKDERFNLRLTTEERQTLHEVAEDLGLSGNASGAVRFMLREKHRQLFGDQKPEPIRAKPKQK